MKITDRDWSFHMFDQIELECFEILHASAEEIDARIRAEGRDPKQVADEVRSIIDDVIKRTKQDV